MQITNHRLRTALLAAGLLAAAPAHAQDAWTVRAAAPQGLNRADAQATTLRHLQNLIAINTENPPGNEIRTAMYFDSVLRAVPGVETRILRVPEDSMRANFVARLRATNPRQKPVLVMGHMDVVGADTTKWQTDAFTPTIRDGYLYGRGAIDDKGMLAATLTALVQLAGQRGRLDRDVIFFATAGEEGGPLVGVDWVIEHHRDLIGDAEFALNEGGRIRVANGQVRTVNIQTTEKVYYDVIATARGTGGHASVPLPDNALAALARAVARVHAWQAPVRLNETTRLYFQRLATIEDDAAMKAAMEQISAAGASQAQIDAAAAVLSRDPLHNAVLRTGASLTLLNGGFRANVIPSEGRATFNVRALPDEDIRAIVRAMNEADGEEQVEFTLDGEPAQAPPPSPVGTELFQAMESAARTMAPSATVVPFMSTGATDGAALRAIGIPTYGILPMPLPDEDELRMHGDNERVPVPAIGWATEYIYRVLRQVAT
ncbi:M20/M25/M40 family metallo-hydrolase [Longimicrobium sp.]|uniref:M20/M25/M40 family metallo-hydrolase n=1 Tax=Longimicrobium sp. TaxID=2029185 RepID=UPI002E2F65EC|nr:M20/M25/M40 family metallo-hydrolase [Longimicrobium sp.]HEX6041996.1 M20/M25/M40 family metallo-hydrolase [Longimicrobium sp.]